MAVVSHFQRQLGVDCLVVGMVVRGGRGGHKTDKNGAKKTKNNGLQSKNNETVALINTLKYIFLVCLLLLYYNDYFCIVFCCYVM